MSEVIEDHRIIYGLWKNPQKKRTFSDLWSPFVQNRFTTHERLYQSYWSSVKVRENLSLLGFKNLVYPLYDPWNLLQPMRPIHPVQAPNSTF